MKPIMQAAVLFLICLLGETIVSLFSLSFPSSVISMIILFLFLLFQVIRQENIQGIIRFLQQNMALFFIPSGVAIMENYSYLRESLIPFLLICVISTIATFAVTAYTVRLVSALMRKSENGKGGDSK